MYKCRDIPELLTDYLEMKLSLGERLKFQWHLGLCRNCRAYLRQMETTRATLGATPKLEIPKDVEAELRKRFQSWKGSTPPQ